MTRALLLWISWMYLLVDGSLGFQIAKDGSFRTSLSDQNFEDDFDSEFEGGESSANQQSSYIYTGLYTPPGAPAPNFNVDFGQNVPSSIWQPSVQFPHVNAEPPSSAQSGTVVWVVQGNEVGQPAVQYPPVNAESPSSAPSGTAMGSIQGKEVGQPTIQYPPVNAEPPSSAQSGTVVWYVQDNKVRQPTIQYPPADSKPLGSPSSNVMWTETNEIEKPSIQYPSVNAKLPGSALSGPAVWSAQGNEVGQPTIQYPPVNARPPSLPVAFVQGNEFDRSTPSRPSPQRLVARRSKGWLDFVFSNSFEDEDFNNMDFQPDNSVMDMETKTIWVPAIAEEPLSLPQKPKTYVVHSKNGYKRGRVVHTKTFYSNDYKKPKIIEKVKSSKQKF